MSSQPIYLQQNNNFEDSLFKTEILFAPTPELFKKCISCGSNGNLNEDMHCNDCAKKNKIFNELMEKNVRR